MNTAHVQKLLEGIGFNHHESNVYLHLLQQGEHPASKIAKATRAPRSTIRSILDKLCDRGVVGKVYRGNTQHYFCLPTEALPRSLEQSIEQERERLAQLRECLPIFCALRGEKVLPKVQYFEGEKGIVEAFNHSLHADIPEVLFLTSYEFLSSPFIRTNDLECYVPRRVKQGIRVRTLSEQNETAIDFLTRADAELREHRFLPKGHDFPGTFMIYGRFVVYFSVTKHECMAALVESESMADTMRMIFEYIWHSRSDNTVSL